MQSFFRPRGGGKWVPLCSYITLIGHVILPICRAVSSLVVSVKKGKVCKKGAVLAKVKNVISTLICKRMSVFLQLYCIPYSQSTYCISHYLTAFWPLETLKRKSKVSAVKQNKTYKLPWIKKLEKKFLIFIGLQGLSAHWTKSVYFVQKVNFNFEVAPKIFEVWMKLKFWTKKYILTWCANGGLTLLSCNIFCGQVCQSKQI